MTFTPEQVERLSGPLNRAYVKPPAPGKYGEYIEGWRVIDEANRIFGFDGWTRETVVMSETARDLVELSGKNGPYKQWRVGYMAKARITAQGVVREGTGFGSGMAKPEALADAIESAVKEAETDAMKRALMTFGNPFGLALYDKTKANVQDVEAAANDQPAEPVARTKLDGPHTSKTALRRAVVDIIAKVRAAQSNAEIDAIQKENIATIKQANKDWPALLTGEPNIEEDVGLKGTVELRREQLAKGEDGQLAMLIASLKTCDTIAGLTGWMATNEALIEKLDDADRRTFEAAFNEQDSAILAVARVNAG